MIAAAIAVVLFCLVGTAAIMGWLPSSIGSNAANRPLSEGERMTLAAGMPQGAAPVQPEAALPYPAQPAARAPEPAYQPAPRAPAPVYEHAPRQLAAAEPQRSHWCANCGNVESIRTIKTPAHGSGVGAGVGAVLGGLLGNQVGSGHGRQLATVGGAVGGAVVGNQLEGNMKADLSYEIVVRLDDGKVRTFHQQSAPQWHTGERVRIVKGSLHPA
jgi:outer membrane lipoprotein SlyB